MFSFSPPPASVITVFFGLTLVTTPGIIGVVTPECAYRTYYVPSSGGSLASVSLGTESRDPRVGYIMVC